MTSSIAQALTASRNALSESDNWRLEAELLLAEVLQKSREYLFSWSDKELSERQLEQFRQLLERRQRGEPIAYLLGRKEFWDFELIVTPDVLIPRPETELLVELALDLLADNTSASIRIADLGTGSGAIAIALARHNKHWQVVAAERSPAAIGIAQKNASKLKVKNIEFIQSDWCESFAGQPEFDLILSNPPYVAQNDKHLAIGDLRFEPQQALVAMNNGLSDLARIAHQSQSYLKQNAWLLLEHGFEQAKDVASLLVEQTYQNIECHQDLAGLDRVTRAQFRGNVR